MAIGNLFPSSPHPQPFGQHGFPPLPPLQNGNSPSLPAEGMAAFIQQQHALQLSFQAQNLGPRPDFESTRQTLVDSITNPAPRSDIQLTDRHQAVVLDEFFSTDMRPAHGFGVASVLQETGNLQADQVALISDNVLPPLGTPTPAALLTAPGDASASQRLNSFIETASASGLSQTNSALEAIADQNAPNLRGVNYSTSGTDLNGFMALNRLAIGSSPTGEPYLTEHGQVIFEGLGITPELNRDNRRLFAERGTARWGEVTENSELVQGQVRRHEAVSERLQEAGVHYTVAAGNDGGVIEDYRSAGVKMADEADDNVYVNPHNISVGSLDTRGTADPSDDRVASHTVLDPEVDFLAPGVDRRVRVFGEDHDVTGTSYAAPDVNGRLIALSRQNPGLSASAIQNLLHNAAGPNVPGSSVSALR